MINGLVQDVYINLFAENSKELVFSLSKLQHYIRRVKNKKSILIFSDWAQLSKVDNYSESWFDSLIEDLFLRSLEFNLLISAITLSNMTDFLEDSHELYKALRITIKNNSLNCFDFLVENYFCHPDSELFPGQTIYSIASSMGAKSACLHLLDKYKVHPCGLKMICHNEGFSREDYSDVIQTVELSSSISYILVSTELNNLEKLDMISFAIEMGADVLGHSPFSELDRPLNIAASKNVVLMEYLLDTFDLDANEDRRELIFSAVASLACVEEKKKIILSLRGKYSADINIVSSKHGYTPIQYAIINHRREDTIETIQLLIELGAKYDVDSLMTLSNEWSHHTLTKQLYTQLNGSKEKYLELVQIEKELQEKEEQRRNNGERNVYIFFPENQY
jgi:ankyrin repeat protein